ncbi:hypothetical protein IMPR6_270006 [Imperialibacter sp. EC-SDR9]|nr:hypothetical protein IMPERIA89_640102 [Imperialibacter sp. 89]CAD5294525.1 hypothetical protein IMPERIA75_670101 [Imperialibacter sp. 75]VVT18213.1 hypothetical protein IMPR6_270006 [Imperialibacter sp. EC-SDR9]
MLTGCFPFADGDTEFINETNYYVYGEPNLDKGVHIGYEDKEWGGIGLIEAPVTAIGYSEDYIFAKREFEKPEYFIFKVIDSGIHSDAESNIIGPLDSLNFTSELEALGVDDFYWKSTFAK